MSSIESDLIARVRKGDAGALAEFLRLKQGPLLSFIERNLGPHMRSRMEAEDLFQETALSAVRALENADLNGREPFNWLCQLAEERIIDKAREVEAAKRDPRREVSGHQPATPETSAELIDLLVATMTSVTKAAVRNERQARLQAAISLLPVQTQQVLRQRYVEGLATREIADQLGKTDGAVRVLLSRTLQQLQQLLGPDSL